MGDLASKILGEYSSVVDELVERGLLLDSRSLIPFQNRQRTMLSWSGGAHLSYLYGQYSTFEHYCSIINQGDFSLCFLDGGLIQIRYDIEDNEITSHRLCYFPCPFSFVSEDLFDVSLSELPLLLSADELRKRTRLISPIRFDFDSEKVDDKHAHSHVSLNKDTCRIPAYGPVSMGHFFRFVLRYFYETEFSKLTEWENVRPQLFSRTLQHPPPHELHFDTLSNY